MHSIEHAISPIADDDRESIMDIFNHYVENSFAAFPENKLPYEAFDRFMQMSNGLPTGTLRDRDGKVVGFGMLRAHNQIPVFARTAEVTYFIHPAHTGKGLGTRLLGYLEQGAVGQGITTILANISSRNPGSIAFHERNGFMPCGLFRNVAEKHGQVFDEVWMQKIL